MAAGPVCCVWLRAYHRHSLVIINGKLTFFRRFLYNCINRMNALVIFPCGIFHVDCGGCTFAIFSVFQTPTFRGVLATDT